MRIIAKEDRVDRGWPGDAPRCAAETTKGIQCQRTRDRVEGEFREVDEDRYWICLQHAEMDR